MTRHGRAGWVATEHAARWADRPDSFPEYSQVYRPSRRRAQIALGLLGVMATLTVAAVIHDASGFDLVRTAEAGLLTKREADLYDNTTQALARFDLILYAAASVAFLAWLSRSVDNIPSLTRTRPLVTPRWSIGWWFVPFANIVQPFRVVNDLYGRLAPAPGWSLLVILWWVAWVVMNLVSIAVLRTPEPTNLVELESWFQLSLAIDISTLVAALLAMAVVWRTQSFAEARAAAAPDRATEAEPG